MSIDSNFYKNKKTKSIYYALWFLIVTLLTTGGLFFYNNHVAAQNQQLLSQISQRQDSIKNLKQDKNIEAYYIYNLNQDILQDLADKSQISNFIKHTLSTMISYDMLFEGFTYNSWEIDLSASAESNAEGLAYTKVIKFLNEYNKNQRSLFVLEPVENFTGQDTINFPVTFTIK